MTALCPRNLPQHFNGCTCVARGAAGGENTAVLDDLAAIPAADIDWAEATEPVTMAEHRAAYDVIDSVMGLSKTEESYYDIGRVLSYRTGLDVGSPEEEQRLNDQVIDEILVAHRVDDEHGAYDAAMRVVRAAEADKKWKATGYEPVAPPKVVDPSNYYGATYVGSNYDRDRSLADVAKSMRSDYKKAIEAGYLPKGVSIRVNKRDTRSITVTVEGLGDSEIWHDRRIQDGDRVYTERTRSWEAQRILSRVEGIADSYVSRQSNSQVDYFNDSHYVTASIEQTEDRMWREYHREHGKALREGGDTEAIEADYRQRRDAYRASVLREGVEYR